MFDSYQQLTISALITSVIRRNFSLLNWAPRLFFSQLISNYSTLSLKMLSFFLFVHFPDSLFEASDVKANFNLSLHLQRGTTLWMSSLPIDVWLIQIVCSIGQMWPSILRAGDRSFRYMSTDIVTERQRQGNDCAAASTIIKTVLG